MEAFYTCADIDFSNGESEDNNPVEEQPVVSDVEPWDETIIYTKGLEVSYEGTIYQTQWWTRGDIPGLAEFSPWKVIKTEDIQVDEEPIEEGTENIAPTMLVLAPQNEQVIMQDTLSTVLIEFEADDSDGTVDSIMAMINGKHYDMKKYSHNIYRLEWMPEAFGSYTVKLHATDNKLSSIMKKVEIEVVKK
jgi:chitinase